MAEPNFENRTLFESDNLPILLGMNSETVDLIATDPPFKKDRKFQGIGPAEGQVMKDTWSWHGDPPGSPGETKKSDIHKDWLDHIRDHWPALNEVVEAAYHAHSPSMAAFLAFMAVRLIEMHRILKPTGSLYLHCDPTANSYLRLLLDSIFGVRNFRNELIWWYNSGARGNQFGKRHDTLLWFTKSHKDWMFNKDSVREPYSPNINIPPSKAHYYHPLGKVMGDVWKLPIIPQNDKRERIGWTTQKPLALYRRIVEASSNEGDMVFDPFCGCATTCVAAEQLNRQWVGIDQSPKAKTIVKDRLAREVQESMAWESHVTVTSAPPPERMFESFYPPPSPFRLLPRKGAGNEQAYRVTTETRCGFGWQSETDIIVKVAACCRPPCPARCRLN